MQFSFEFRAILEQEVKRRRHYEKLKADSEVANENHRRELRLVKETAREKLAKARKIDADVQRLDAIVGKFGDDVIDELQLRKQENEERRIFAEQELGRLRIELNFQESSRTEDRLTLTSVEEQLATVRTAKRQVERRKIEAEASLEKATAQLRMKKREISELRKRAEQLGREREHMSHLMMHHGIEDSVQLPQMNR